MNDLEHDPSPKNTDSRGGAAIWVVAVLMGALCGLAFVEEVLGSRGDAAFFGWATLVAAPWITGVLAGICRPQKPVSTSLLASVVSLLTFAPIAGEGAICLIFIAPWFLVVAPVVAVVTGGIMQWKGQGRKPLSVIFLLLFPSGALWWEQRHPPGVESLTLSDSVIIAAPVEQVWSELSGVELSLTHSAPWLIRALLPQPQSLTGGGAHVGAERHVVFDNGVILARIIRSAPPSSFEMELTVTESGTEFFDHWAKLGRSTMTLEALPDGRTRLTHSTLYEPRVTVRWYSEPIERELGHLLQGYLLSAFAEQLFAEPAPTPPVAWR